MTPPSRGALYSPQMLALAVSLSDYPLTGALQFSSEASSRVCGSRLRFECSTNPGGGIERLGLQVSACAVGQAAAAVFAQGAADKSRSDIETGLTALLSWLEGSGALPEWPGIDALEPAVPHKGRHAAIQLPWKAALDALCKGSPRG